MIKISEEESKWIDEQIQILSNIKENPSNFSDEEIKKSFDFFFETVCSWRERYNTKNLANFWAIGVDYDGFQPGNNPSFIKLYSELVSYVEDKILDKPIYYITEQNGKWVEIEESEDGSRKLIKELK